MRKRQGYQRPSGNKFKNRSTGSRHHPLEVPYKGLEIGDKVRIRVLSLSEDETVIFEGREVSITNPKTKKPMTIKVALPLDKNGNVIEESLDLRTPGGKRVGDGREVFFYRIPVWLYSIQKGKNAPEEIGALRYLEMTQGLRDSLDELETFQDGLGEFNPETGRPDYDIFLRIVEAKMVPFSYRFDVINLGSNKKQDPAFGVEVEEFFTDEMFDAIDEQWDDVIDAMFTAPTMADLEKRLGVDSESTDEDDEDAEEEEKVSRRGSTRASSETGSNSRRRSAREEPAEETEDDEEAEVVETKSTRSSRTRSAEPASTGASRRSQYREAVDEEAEEPEETSRSERTASRRYGGARR